jgi:calcineurin-like phosphoesterase
MTNGRVETLRILANAFDELEQLRCRLRDDSEHVMHAMDAARADERAAVVAWLRSQVSQAAGDDDYAYDHAADAIERGEHRREEGA